MKKYVIFSSDNNPHYYFFLPIASLAWINRGYTPIVSVVWPFNNLEKIHHLVLNNCEKFGASILKYDSNEILNDKDFDGYNLSMLSQISRFCFPFFTEENSYCLTSDADMIPVDEKWFHQQDFNKDIHLFYANGYKHTRYPICYIGMNRENWKSLFGFTSNNKYEGLKELLCFLKRGDTKENQWGYDEILFFKKISNYKDYPYNCHMIDREIYPNPGFKRHLVGVPKELPYGRLDRSFWNLKRMVGDLVDIHCMRTPFSRANRHHLIMVFNLVFEQKDLSRIVRYMTEFGSMFNV